MMSDSVLEFGFAKEGRQIGVAKLPLGSAGEWIESSVFNWGQPTQVTVDRAPQGRRFMDSGGYIEDIKEGVAEGVKGALTQMGVGGNQNQPDMPAQQQSGGQQNQIPQNQIRDVPGMPMGANKGQIEAMNQFTSEMAKAFENGLSHLKLEAPNLKELKIDRVQLSQLNDQIQGLVSKEQSLSSAAKENKLQHEESRRRLDKLANQEHKTSSEIKELDGRTKALMTVVDEKRNFIKDIENSFKKEKENHEMSLKRKEAILVRSQDILEKKKKLEEKIRSLVDGNIKLSIDLDPYLSKTLGIVDSEIIAHKEAMESLQQKIDATALEISHLELQVVDNSERQKMVDLELQHVQEKKAKVQSELGLITKARTETENKLGSIAESKKELQAKLQMLMEEARDE